MLRKLSLKGLHSVVVATELNTYVFTKAAVKRSIDGLTQLQIHEHFAGYLAILRATKQKAPLPVKSADITAFHDLYMRAAGAPENAPYVRPFKSRGQGLETFNANVAGSYAPSSLRSKGKLIDVIEVSGSGRSAIYGLRANHAALALGSLVASKVPIVALSAFIYRDYGFHLSQPRVDAVVALFRKEFGLSAQDPVERKVFDTLFFDDSADYDSADLELNV
ncbi:hypothetical protein OSH10_08240 [Kaistia defluvii]|uniref:hypothetical protein n=1 Tax=Kaistia defluvii TaxID=410841 RepID=UPI002255CAA9|nr:hypothetical protein [Kaistia defluvii]MCX5518422.1 hypothetical protein [Kaistia defluvii]